MVGSRLRDAVWGSLGVGWGRDALRARGGWQGALRHAHGYAAAFSPTLMRMLRPAIAKGVDGEWGQGQGGMGCGWGLGRGEGGRGPGGAER